MNAYSFDVVYCLHDLVIDSNMVMYSLCLRVVFVLNE